MLQRLDFRRFKRVRKLNKDPVKLTALLYLREALLTERYEECAELIDLALARGAQPIEIRFLLEDARRMPRF
jgi:hypothetical protein